VGVLQNTGICETWKTRKAKLLLTDYAGLPSWLASGKRSRTGNSANTAFTTMARHMRLLMRMNMSGVENAVAGFHGQPPLVSANISAADL
jgi:hypothetical protein